MGLSELDFRRGNPSLYLILLSLCRRDLLWTKIVIEAVFGSRNSISGKYSIFRKCYFPERKMFLCVWMYFKKFFEKYFLVFGKCYKEKTNPSPPGQNPDWRLTLAISPRRKTHHDRVGQTHHDRTVDREIAKHRAASRDRDRREREIAIDGAISRSVDRDLASTAPITISVKARSPSRIAIDGAGACDRRRLELGACERRGLVLSLSRTALIRDREQCEVLCDLSLSLSLSGIHLKWK